MARGPVNRAVSLAPATIEHRGTQEAVCIARRAGYKYSGIAVTIHSGDILRDDWTAHAGHVAE